ncbi:Metalloenzyme, LuxS/M16 peptidase-like protein [Geopyxis carbonaria]|nr:Metalloenzyme, LuxS/M16 peptidase-like protein [Geopyxis carbonaria]
MTNDANSSPNGVKLIASKFEQPDLDNRSYRVIQLPNKLEVLLVHDPDTDKASAALDVHAGNFSDKDDLQGQAHAVEHLLFMGTKKYPKENEYSQYLSEHSGHSNAYTASTSTNYYFEVGHEHFHGGLDRFAQFFIAPLFLEETLDRELRAVDSEHKKNLQNDTWRLHQLSKSNSNPDHPYCHFSTGSLQTLKELPAKRGVNVRDEFMQFHARHYSANVMKLVVLGREDLDTLEKWVVELFSDINNKDLPDPKFEGQPLLKEHLLTQIFAKPVMDTRTIDLMFPFMDEEELYRTHPSRYAGHLIGHEGPGSLLAYLKKKGWANSLSAGASPVANGSAFFHVGIKLTEAGLAHYEEIVRIVFAYINLIKDEPPKEWIFKELQSTAAIDFKFREKSPASKFTSRYAANMQRPVPREWLLSANSLLREWDPELITKSLDFLRPDNFRLMVVAQDCPRGEFDQVEKWYKTEYRVEKIPEEFLEAIAKTAQKGNGAGADLKNVLYLPHVNEFIPTNFDVQKKEVKTPANAPSLIKNSELSRIWYKKDDRFWVPKANVFITLRNPLVYSTPANAVTTRVYCDLVKDALSEYAYDAEIAGLEYGVNSSAVGLEIDVSGYNDKMSVLLEKVLRKMRDPEISEDRFKVIKERTLRAYRNWKFQPPYYQVGEFTRYLSSPNMWLNEDVLMDLNDLTVDDVKSLYPKILKSAHIEALVHGNLYKEDALKYVDLVESIIKPQPLPLSQYIIRRSIIPPPNTNIVWTRNLQDPKNVNSTIEYVLHVGEQRDRKLRMLLSVFAQLTDEPCFNQLRTKEQLGYIVFSGYRAGTTTMSYRIIVQSERPAPYLESRVEEFLKSFKENLNNLTDKEFQGHVKAVILKKMERLKNLEQESSRLWARIGNEVYDFFLHETDVEILKNITKQEVVDFYNEYISPDSPNRSKMSVQMKAAAKPDDEEKLKALVDALTQFLSAGSISTEPKELSKALENVDIHSIEDVVARITSFLKDVKQVPEAAIESLITQGKPILQQALPPPKTEDDDKFNPEDFGTVLDDVVGWKARCSVSPGAIPIKPLVEFEDTTSKL